MPSSAVEVPAIGAAVLARVPVVVLDIEDMGTVDQDIENIEVVVLARMAVVVLDIEALAPATIAEVLVAGSPVVAPEALLDR